MLLSVLNFTGGLLPGKGHAEDCCSGFRDILVYKRFVTREDVPEFRPASFKLSKHVEAPVHPTPLPVLRSDGGAPKRRNVLYTHTDDGGSARLRAPKLTDDFYFYFYLILIRESHTSLWPRFNLQQWSQDGHNG